MREPKAARRIEHLRLIAVFALLGALMYISDILMEFLPNVHLVGVLTVVYTIVYRAKALIPIYIYVLLNGLFSGFGIWWLGYLYIWTILWGAVMLLPKNIGGKRRVFIYTAVCTLHGLIFGLLYIPVQMIYSTDIRYLLSWLTMGFITADIYHAVGNCIFGLLLIVPLSELIIKTEKKFSPSYDIQ